MTKPEGSAHKLPQKVDIGERQITGRAFFRQNIAEFHIVIDRKRTRDNVLAVSLGVADAGTNGVAVHAD